MRFRQTTVISGRLDGCGAFNRLAKGLYRNPRRRRDVRVGCGIGRRGRHWPGSGDCNLLSVLDHLPISVILPTSKPT